MLTEGITMLRARPVALGLAILMLAALPAAAQIALVGGGYGQYVRNSLIKKVILPLDLVYEDFGTSMDFSDLSRWRLIIVAHGDEALTEGQEGIAEALEAYVREGGHVLMIGNAPTALLGGRNFAEMPWVGAGSWVYLRESPTSSLAQPEHPWLAHLDPATDYYWLSASQYLRTPSETAEVLIGAEQAIYLSRNDYGEGWCAFLARGPFPFTRENVGPMRNAQAQMLSALIAEAVSDADGLPTAAKLIARETAALDAGDAVLWQRDWEFGSKEGPQFRPYAPQAEELADEVRIDVARAERESVAVNLTSSELSGPVVAEVVGLPAGAPEVEVRVMDRAPLIPWTKPDVEPYESPFWLMPTADLEPVGAPEFMLQPGQTRVLWLQVHSPADAAPGDYTGELRVTGGDRTVASAPVLLKVWPVTLPEDRAFTLRTWGCSSPDQRFWDEFGRQSCVSGHLSYPDLKKVMLPEHEISLSDALKQRPELFADPANFPKLDFSYLDPYVDGQVAAGQTVFTFQDVRTGGTIANAGTGLEVAREQIPEAPQQWRDIWVAYYRQLMDYLKAHGVERAEAIWTDEPSVETIAINYVPIAEMYIAAGMHPGSHWTTPGFMTADDVNRFAHAVSDWSMYTIMMPNFRRFIEEGSVTLRDDAIIGATRGGYGFAHRNPYSNSRRLGWNAWSYDMDYLRTGPTWKGWLYYVNYERSVRDEGVAGERLVAYGSADPTALSVPLVPSPDWEASRDTCDDISLVRMLEAAIAEARQKGTLPAARLDAIEAELAGFLGEASPYNLHLEPKHYEHGDLSYDYTSVVDATSADLARAKRRVLELLTEVSGA